MNKKFSVRMEDMFGQIEVFGPFESYDLANEFKTLLESKKSASRTVFVVLEGFEPIGPQCHEDLEIICED
jgi:hypothetical protein